MNKIIITTVCFLSAVTLFKVKAQDNIMVMDDNNKVVDGYYLLLVNKKDTLVLNSFNEISEKKLLAYKQLVVTHINYNLYFLNDLKRIPDTIVLKHKETMLDEVILAKKREKKRKVSLEGLVRLLYDPPTNSSFNHKWASFKIPKGTYIKDIDIHLQKNFEGVKNIDRGVFKISLYSIDSITATPFKSFYTSDTLKNTGKSSVYNLKMRKKHIKVPKNGFFVVFEVLDKKCYSPLYISSKVGTITATPMVKNKYSKNYSKRTYLMSLGRTNENWQLKPIKLKIDIHYEN
ncbi:hypothetical protein NBRC110019_05450 [Neptunitalea chrysea]|uniref:Uncharacterized protein n=1 Tax=Neptunitalea chrysea TaxID=1647581 RepID=A0A9W6B342_9FLAO|nr:hypothetical protein [Neptunitalea chrysea]GLB51506.1 hypothetical protein NBRC110019_05450 [Neptunitalea chrysea]